jgi:Tfp pilus assembly protein PilX
MSVLNIVGTVIFLGVLVISLLAVVDVFSSGTNSKRSSNSAQKLRAKPNAEARLARRERFAPDESNQRH